jgi:hypothetical protein
VSTLEILGAPLVRQFIIPAVATFLGIWIKRVSRPDETRSFQRDDWAIGPSLAVTAVFAYFIFLINAGIQRRKIMASGDPITPELARRIDELSSTAEASFLLANRANDEAVQHKLRQVRTSQETAAPGGGPGMLRSSRAAG